MVVMAVVMVVRIKIINSQFKIYNKRRILNENNS
jgi:hypothetical protein